MDWWVLGAVVVLGIGLVGWRLESVLMCVPQEIPCLWEGRCSVFLSCRHGGEGAVSYIKGMEILGCEMLVDLVLGQSLMRFRKPSYHCEMCIEKSIRF